jgi:hypothetical protein
MYAVQARIVREQDGWTSTTHLPTFYLDERVQGILDEDHAARIARSILDPFDERPYDGDDDTGRLFVEAVAT